MFKIEKNTNYMYKRQQKSHISHLFIPPLDQNILGNQGTFTIHKMSLVSPGLSFIHCNTC